MCTKGLDCLYCEKYDSIANCPMVASAFPTAAEEDAAKTAHKTAGGRASYQRGSWYQPKPDESAAHPRQSSVSNSARKRGQAKTCAICRSAPRESGRYCRACARAKAATYYAGHADTILTRRRRKYASQKSAKGRAA
jgi:hypothetical protein